MRVGAINALCRSRGVALVAVTMLLAGCSRGLESLPLGAPAVAGDSYSLTAAFSSALNLPTKAKVKLNGADIGEVDAIRVRNFIAYVTIRIRGGILLHVGTTAELRSATPLGDLFVGIHDPGQSPDAPLLHNGDTIPLASTSAAATVEDVLSAAALLLNGGAIRQLVSIVNGAGTAVGGHGDKLAALLHQSNTLVSRLNARSTQINTALRSTSELAATISARQNTLNEVVAAAGPATGVIADNTTQLMNMVDTVARTTRQLSRFPSLRGTDTRSLIADFNHLSAAFNDISVDPELSLTSMNRLIPLMLKSLAATGLTGRGELVRLAIGSLPDKNFPGDPEGFHGPDGTDYHAMIGSLRYEWNLLLSKVLGADR